MGGEADPSGGGLGGSPAAGGDVPGSPEDIRLWRALASVQLAHEASLLHDDVIDAAPLRRGAATVAAARGVGAALVEGDHLLTTAYRLAAATGSLEWVALFARAVERTVAGEKAQAAGAGRALGWQEYEEIVLGKSGELLGAALAAPAVLSGLPESAAHYRLGRRIGLVYQMLDDLLDYSPTADLGKAPLADRARGLWTWPLLFVDGGERIEADEIVRRLALPDPLGVRPADRAVDHLRDEATAAAAAAVQLFPADPVLRELLASWIGRAEAAVAMLPLARPAGAPAAAAARGAPPLPPVDDWERLLRTHARSFHFAARLFPAARRRQVMGVYAWCRYTDDLVDGQPFPAPALEARLDAWLELSRRAYEGEHTGNDLADHVMGQMRTAGVPFGYAAELIEGMRMDVRGASYETLAELRAYTYRVASVVGLWLCELFDVRDPWMLGRASALGHAMQLTNIARDVGEDLRAGRVYVPAAWLADEGLSRDDLVRMMEDGRPDDRLRAVVARLLQAADDEYRLASAAIPLLPGFFRHPVAVAAAVYHGIHEALRRNDLDPLTRRAYTSLPEKLRLGAAALGRTALARPRVCHCRRIAAALGLGVLSLLAVTGIAAQDPGASELPPVSVTTGSTVVAARPAVTAVAGPAGPADPALDAVARLWRMGVDDEGAVDAGLDVIASLRAGRRPTPSSPLDLLLRAYEGSFTALRGKHGSWPPARLRALRSGFGLMDAAVAAAPDDPRLRYIRLRSGFHLPGIFGRKTEVDDDLAALARVLPERAGAFDDDALAEVVAFVLQHGAPSPSARRVLENLLRSG